MKITLKITSVLLLAIATLALGIYISQSSVYKASASVDAGSEYENTLVGSSTASSTATTLIRSGRGVLGQLTLTSSSISTVSYPQITLYDATSTSVATSTATKIAEFSADLSTLGTYTFDVVFENGLILEIPAGFNGIANISSRR